MTLCAWTGTGLLLINNISQIQIALGGDRSGGDVFVTVLSVCSGLGRMMIGVASAHFAQHRPFFMSLTMLCLVVSMLALLSFSRAALWVSCVITGWSFGAINCLNATLVSEIFGLTHFSGIYGTMSLALALGSFVMASYLVGQVNFIITI